MAKNNRSDRPQSQLDKLTQTARHLKADGKDTRWNEGLKQIVEAEPASEKSE